MTLLSRYTTSNFAQLLNEIYSDRIVHYPFNSYSGRFVPVNNEQGKLEIELAGFSKDEIEVFTEQDVLYVKAKKKDSSTSRSYYRAWPLAKDEVIGKVNHENGLLTIEISKVIPEKQKRKDYLIE